MERILCAARRDLLNHRRELHVSWKHISTFDAGSGSVGSAFLSGDVLAQFRRLPV